ncbi:hypothetical protein TSUD_283950 [Trifolium subterraneum]|uniref:TF-B3 domain-containing protein n=1 Tax=Trifolium subterraneum TaxID=3900 RepID=A0A2Z6NHH3_TRISU|nr:hypothetical protein TSUD_283950 [Trifolium subterraneum]
MADEHDINTSIETFVNERRQGIPLDNKRDMQGIEWDLQGYAMMTRTCYLEFDPLRTKAKLPTCFVRSLGSSIYDWVVLQDPKRNQIQVSIERKNSNIYLTNGWCHLKDLYGLYSGGKTIPYFVALHTFYHRLEKYLTYADVDSGILLALPNQETQLTMVDWRGNTWVCMLRFPDYSPKIVHITG